jgi:hypothetical protein
LESLNGKISLKSIGLQESSSDSSDGVNLSKSVQKSYQKLKAEELKYDIIESRYYYTDKALFTFLHFPYSSY